MDDPKRKQALREQGVTIECPDSVAIASDINPSRIAPETTIHAGCRLAGVQTSIGPGSVLGAEAPVTLRNCQLGHHVQLKGGTFNGATLLDGVTFGSGAHVRLGTLLEEHAACAHTVGLKQTLLMPFVTLGSLINFCDCLMSGGTGSRNHSEVGSSYIHFNFTAHQDKATPSLIGDVPAGVMLDQPPIFLGGQGGLVGPARIAYGTITAAGTICRRDVTRSGQLVFGETGHRIKSIPYDSRLYGPIDRLCLNNILYIGNLRALQAWYRDVRPPLMASDVYTQACLKSARAQLDTMIAERIKRLAQLADKVAQSLEISAQRTPHKSGATFEMQQRFVDTWPSLQAKLDAPLPPDLANTPACNAFLEAIHTASAGGYVDTIQALPPSIRQQGTRWLQHIVNSINAYWKGITDG